MQVSGQRDVEWREKVAALAPTAQEAAMQEAAMRARLDASQLSGDSLQPSISCSVSAVPYIFDIENARDALDELVRGHFL